MGLESVTLAVLLLGMVTMACAATACPGGKTFGYNCEYQCHCAEGLPCDTDGSCSNKCDTGWEGEYCQRGNVAAGKSSSQSSTDDFHNSSLAVDGSTSQTFSSCSQTKYQVRPWWQVNLGKKYVLFTVEIWSSLEGDARECKSTEKGTEYRGTMNTTKDSYPCDYWPDALFPGYSKPANSYNFCRNPNGYMEGPWCSAKDERGYKFTDYCNVSWCPTQHFEILFDLKLCHPHTEMVKLGEVANIRCETPLVGQYLTITLDSSTVLTLCEVSVQAFLYRECRNKRYGPNCNNRCQCANDVTCDDKTGECPSGLCNDRFTGPYCNIGIPSISNDGPSSPTSISFQWQYIIHDSAYDAGRVKRFDLIYNDTATSSSGYIIVGYPNPGMIKANVTGLKPSTQYSFHVELTWYNMSSLEFGEANGPTADFRTASCAGYMVRPEISVTSNKIAMVLAWPNRVYLVINAQVPGMISGCIKDLVVYAKKTNESKIIPSLKEGQTYTLHRLPAFTDYDIIATVKSPDGKQKNSSLQITTAEDVPGPPNMLYAEGNTSSSFFLVWTKPKYPNGILKEYRVNCMPLFPNNDESVNETFYVKVSNFTQETNRLNVSGLTTDTEYNCGVAAQTSKGYGPIAWLRTWPEPEAEGAGTSASFIGPVVGLASILFALIILLIVVVILRRKRREQRKKHIEQGEASESLGIELLDKRTRPESVHVECETPETNHESTVPMVQFKTRKGYTNLQGRTIKISDLAPYVKSIRGYKAKEFKDEFEDLPVCALRSIKKGKQPENMALNRYRDIATYDHSRVVLQPIDDEKSDYINASFIHGYDIEKAYIASQGPLPISITATWRMIWQERCATIVMLTNLEEKGRIMCMQYWPSQGNETYGPFTVQLAEEYTFPDYVKRFFKVTLKGEVRIVKSYHFTAWPDRDVPKFACSLLNFRANVMKETAYGEAPLMVHCSAGVGRTGTFIAIDYLIRQGIAEKKVNFYECVLKMRENRPNMVQNLGQYKHIHDAILEFFEIGITFIERANFPQKYAEMIEPIPGKKTCQLQNQYSILGSFTGATTPSKQALDNMGKNRNREIIPDGRSRVILSLPIKPIDGWDDYVNAVYATGYGEKDSYIITQMPLPETMKDIWRIVHDTGTSTIVMMNFVDDTYEFTTVYWPQKTERLEYGPLVVEGIDTDTSNRDITVRDLKLSTTVEEGAKSVPDRLVRHFQLQNWPDGRTTPSSPESIVQLLEMVEKWQQKVENKKILVQCLDGASQSGVFCVAHSVIEKVKVDHEVDVFQYLRLLRSNRPQLVKTYEQYKFIHEVVLRYLQGLDIYA